MTQTLAEKLASRMLAHNGNAAIWDVHVAAAAAKGLGNHEMAASLVEIAEAAAEQYRERAKLIRRQVETLNNAEVRRQLQGIAAEYDRLADSIERARFRLVNWCFAKGRAGRKPATLSKPASSPHHFPSAADP